MPLMGEDRYGNPTTAPATGGRVIQPNTLIPTATTTVPVATTMVPPPPTQIPTSILQNAAAGLEPTMNQTAAQTQLATTRTDTQPTQPKPVVDSFSLDLGGSKASGPSPASGAGSGGGYSGGAYGDKINKLIDQVLGGTFSYDPMQDPEYKQAAAQVENQVAQMMVGRGGLYSSVVQQEVQNGLQSLQTSMRANAYNKWVSERNQTMQLIEWVQAQDDRSYARWQAQQQSKIDSSRTQIDNRTSTYEMQSSLLSKYTAEWQNGQLSNAGAAFFKVNPGTPYNAYRVKQAGDQLSAYDAETQRMILSSNYDEAKLGIAQRVATENAATAPGTISTSDPKFFDYAIKQMGTADQSDAYFSDVDAALSKAGGDYAKMAAAMRAMRADMVANPDKYKKRYGEAIFVRAQQDLFDKALEYSEKAAYKP